MRSYMDGLREAMQEKRELRRWALITGSSRGLGRELALAFGREEFNVILHDSGRNFNQLEKLRDYLTEHEVLTEVVRGPLTDRATLAALAAMGETKKINVLVNNAGEYHRGPASEGDLFQLIAVNLVAPIQLCRTLLPTLQATQGMIVNINSMAAHSPAAGESIYAATKAGLEGFSKAFKLETMPVRVIDVFLGAMKTDMTAGRPNAELLIKPEAAAAAIAGAVRASCHNSSIRFDSLDLRRGWY